MIPANPGGGWDTTGRALGKAMTDGKLVDTVTYDNKGGAAGALGLAQFINGSKNDPNALMVMGAVMLVGIITDGDLRRHMDGLMTMTASEVATPSPTTVPPSMLAVEAVALMNERKIHMVFVVEDDLKPIGILHIHDCLHAGVM